MSEAIVRRADELTIKQLKDQLIEKDKQIDYAKSIIKSLLDNSDEYAEQRARDFIKE